MFAFQGRDTLIGEAVDTRVLVGVLLANGLVVLYRLGAIADAARLGRRSSGTAVTLAILCTLVVVPHAAAGWYAYTAYDTVTEVFEQAEPTDVLVPVPDEFDVPDTDVPDDRPGVGRRRQPRARGDGGGPRRERAGEEPPRVAEARAGSTSCCSAPTRAPAAPACAPTR